METKTSYRRFKSKKPSGRKASPLSNRALIRADAKLWNSFTESPPRYPVPRGNKVVTVTKNVDFGTIMTTGAAVVHAQLTFQLSDLADAASYTAIFDQYKINLVEVWAVPTLNANTGEYAALMASVLDYDDNSALTTLAAAQEYDTCLQAPLINGHYRSLKPHVAVAAYSGAFTSFANMQNQWIDCASSGVQHYGIKYVAEIDNVLAVPVRAYGRYHVSFRAVR